MATLGSIYVLVDPRDGEVRYVGGTAKTLEERLQEHVCIRSKDRTHRANWIKALARLGYRPIIRLVQYVGVDWPDAERYWIKFCKDAGCRLTNGTAGGDGALDPSPETRARISAAVRNRSPEVRAKIAAANRGRKNSAETIAKMRTAASNRSPEYRAKIGNANRRRTPEVREKLRTAHRGRPKSTEHRAKLSAANLGHVHSLETRAKIGAAHRGRKNSAETIAKMRAAAQNRSPEYRAKMSAAQKERYRKARSA